MRKFILITAMVLASATAHAGEPRSLTLASGDEPAKSVETKPAEPAAAETPKYVERPAAVDTTAQPPCPPDTASAQPSKAAPKDLATTDKPKRRHQSTESRIISELHRHGIYW